MTIRSVQWNVGGAKTLRDGANPLLMSSYDVDGLQYVIEYLRELKPDVVTLQETHASNDVNQAGIIASGVGLGFFVNDEYADSHIESGQRLGQSIISRFPLSRHKFQLFLNPELERQWEDGSVAKSHDKGVTTGLLELGEDRLEVSTLHLAPFGKFGVNILSEEFGDIRSDIYSKLRSTSEKRLIQGDFNFDDPSLIQLLPGLYDGGVEEVLASVPTTPKSRRYDHVLYKGIKLISSRTDDSVPLDHYPVITDFEV